MFKGVKLRIYPNDNQIKQIESSFGAVRFVWNQMLAMQADRYEFSKAKLLTGFDMNNLLPTLKAEYAWLNESNAQSLQQACTDLYTAYQKFFKEHKGYPKFKSKKTNMQSYKVKQYISVKNKSLIKLPKLGLVKYKGSIPFDNYKIKSATIKRVPSGKYYCSLLVEHENQMLPKTNKVVGLDLGLADLIITSEGHKYKTNRFDKRLFKQKHIWELKLARRRLLAKQSIVEDKHNKVINPRELNDFSNYVRARQRVAKYNEHIANQRNDYIHKITTELVRNYDVIVIEDLKTKNLLHNHSLARAISNQGWTEIRRQLEYKCAWYGKQLVIVSPYKTSQICSECGYDDGKHTLDVREWTCPSCGTHHDRDINAAKNIKNLGLGQAVVNRETPIN